jgi:hypothetical protein
MGEIPVDKTELDLPGAERAGVNGFSARSLPSLSLGIAAEFFDALTLRDLVSA